MNSSSPTPNLPNKNADLQTKLEKDLKVRTDFKVVHELETKSLVVEEVKLERNGKPLDRYFFRNLGLYIKEVWFMFVYAAVNCFKTYTNFRNFVPNVKGKWKTFKRFWSENWNPLVFVSRIGEFWVDFTRWVRTPRRGNGNRRRFFSFYIFAGIFAFSCLIMLLATPEGYYDDTMGMYVEYSFLEFNGPWFYSILAICLFAFIQSSFGFNNIYKRFLNTFKRYPLYLSIITGLVIIGFYFLLEPSYVAAFNLNANDANYALMNAIVKSTWGLICLVIYVLIVMDGIYNIIARFFFNKGVDGSVTLTRNLKGWVYMLPCLVPLFAFTFLPMINALLMGFVVLDREYPYTEWTLWGFLFKVITNENGFIQKHLTLEYFQIAITDPSFYHSIITTAIIAFVTVPICTFISIIIAVFLNSIKKIQGLFQTIYFLPYVTAMTAITAVWRLLLSDSGIINALFGSNISWLNAIEPMFRIGGASFSGFVNGQPYYTYGSWAYPVYPQMFGYMMYSIWDGLAFKIVIFLSGLQSIDKQVYQAAELDGASSARKFLKITVPLLAPILLFNTLTSLIGAFKIYTATKTLFLNEPRFQTIVFYLFSFMDRTAYSQASAVAVLLFILLLCFTLIRMFISKRTNIRMSKEDKKIAKARNKNLAKKSRAEKILSGGVQ